ncbi:hypothetical protein [Streptomyces sp. BBFR102]|uniref:hypothetical protein n=1 Tax=Streptomyces sp. BBFR102 TaxID=3448171 RepID=UPI003F52CF93
MVLAERAESLREELAEIGVEVARLEAAEAVDGQWAEATDGGRRPSGIVEPAAVTPGAAGMRPVPDRVDGRGLEAPTSDYRRIMEIVADTDGPVIAKDVARALGRELTPGKVEPARNSRQARDDSYGSSSHSRSVPIHAVCGRSFTLRYTASGRHALAPTEFSGKSSLNPFQESART